MDLGTEPGPVIFTGFGYNRVQDDHSREENEMHEIDNNNITRSERKSSFLAVG